MYKLNTKDNTRIHDNIPPRVDWTIYINPNTKTKIADYSLPRVYNKNMVTREVNKLFFLMLQLLQKT